MADKRICSADDAVADVSDGAVVMIGGFALPGLAQELIEALIRHGPRRLTTISRSAHGRIGTLYEAARLVEAGLVAKCITSFPPWPSETSAVSCLPTLFGSLRHGFSC